MASGHELAREKYRRWAPTYDRQLDSPLWRVVRRRLVARLHLEVGQVVLDVACGTGSNFPAIEQWIGAHGRLIGVDLSPDMLAAASQRVARHGWRNVELIQAPVEEAELSARCDAVLFSLSHDVMRSVPALENVFSTVRPGGRVAVLGGKWAPWPLVPVNLMGWLVARRAVTTFEGYRRPWDLLDRWVEDLRVQPILLGGAYVASGFRR